MKKVFYIIQILFFVSILAIEAKSVETNLKTPVNFVLEDEWILSDGRNHLSYKNIHYKFIVEQEDKIEINIKSNIASHIYILDDLGLKLVDTNDDNINKTLARGEYELVIASSYKNKSGKFKLFISGVSEIEKIESNYYKVIDSWTSSGGRSKNSFKNRHYEIQVTKDSYIDIKMTSEPMNRIYLIDSDGFVTENYDQLQTIVKPGKYRIVAATNYMDEPKTGISANFKLEIFGHNSKPVKIESVELSLLGKWINSSGKEIDGIGNKKYTFVVTKKSYVDIVLNQPSSEVIIPNIFLQMPDGTIKETNQNRMFYELEPGNYTITAATLYQNKKGSFYVKIYGSHVKDLKEIQ